MKEIWLNQIASAEKNIAEAEKYIPLLVAAGRNDEANQRRKDINDLKAKIAPLKVALNSM